VYKRQYYVSAKELEILEKELGDMGYSGKMLSNPKMLKIALCVAKGARDRTESRGAHYREDFLKRDDANWLNRTITSWANPDDLEPTIYYE